MPVTLPRDITRRLERWRSGARPKPLVLRGPRQVGKTTLVRAFGQRYDHFVELNLERDQRGISFAGMPPVREWLLGLFLREGLSPKPGASVLLFIDEIQQVPDAIQYLRYLYEDQEGVHVIAAGSLLEFALGEVRSMPVGRVEFLSLYPLTFSEYLAWVGKSALAEALRSVPAASYAHPHLEAAFRDYALAGGMPEVVKGIRGGAAPAELRDVYASIWESYRVDLERHARSDHQRAVLQFLLGAAPHEHDRFAYARFGGSEYRSRDVKEALELLQLARVLRIVRPTSATRVPLVANTRARPRLQFLDTGLLNYATGLIGERVTLPELSIVYRGRLALHVVTQELIAAAESPDFEPFFWTRESAQSNAEVDLLYRTGGRLLGLEVKSGPQGKLRSLHQYVERAGAQLGIRALENRASFQDATTAGGYAYRLLNVPLYGVSELAAYVRWAEGDRTNGSA